VTRLQRVANELAKLHLSQRGVVSLLQNYPLDAIELQLQYLPFRNARRPNAFIVDAIRGNYSPPKEFTYAKYLPESQSTTHELDESAQQPV
jgi:hypothetical protein